MEWCCFVIQPEDAVFDLDEFGGLEIIPNAGSSVQ